MPAGETRVTNPKVQKPLLCASLAIRPSEFWVKAFQGLSSHRPRKLLEISRAREIELAAKETAGTSVVINCDRNRRCHQPLRKKWPAFSLLFAVSRDRQSSILQTKIPQSPPLRATSSWVRAVPVQLVAAAAAAVPAKAAPSWLRPCQQSLRREKA